MDKEEALYSEIIKLPSGQFVNKIDSRRIIADCLQWWLDYHARTAGTGSHLQPSDKVIAPEWPDRGTLENWVYVLRA